MVVSTSDPVDALILDLLEWLDGTPRPYVEVMEAWRTSCPRLPVWEDANDRGFVTRGRLDGSGELVLVTPAGRAHLRQQRPAAPQPALR
jgi:D-3-phosphoglycerate dehydrogenase / 2-oxoglutarate reductase